MNPSGNKLEALQVLRAIAAGMVVYVHALSTYKDKVAAIDSLDWNYGFGELGVKIFFCISGYIIFSSSQSLIPGWSSVNYFLRRRLIRIAPLYWCATLVYAAKLALQGLAPKIDALVFSLFFVPFSDDAGLMRPVLGAGWTLNYEILFYFVLGFTLFGSRKFRLPIVVLFMALLVLTRGLGLLEQSVNFIVNAFFLLSESYLLFFVFGAMVLPLSRMEAIKYLPRFNWKVTCFLVLLLLSVLVFFSVFFKLTSVVLLSLELIICALSVLFCVLAKNTTETTLVEQRVVMAGDGSYSTYLTHGFVMGPAARILGVVPFGISPGVFAGSMVIVCTVVGMFLFKYFEYPLMTWMNSKWGKGKLK